MAKKHSKKMLNIISHKRNTKQKHNEISLMPRRMAIIKKTDETNVDKNMEKSQPLYTAVRNVKCCSHFARTGSSSKGEYSYHIMQQFHSWVYT